MRETLLSVEGLTKTFAGVRAVDEVSLRVGAGEIVALLGHNGSGKSTVVKVLAGIHSADGGTVALADGAELHFIHQDLGLVHELNTVENLALLDHRGGRGLAPLRGRDEIDATRRSLATFDTDIDLARPMGELTPAQRAIVAIARALAGWTHERNVLVLDEPTEALHHDEVDILFAAVRRVAARGAGVVFISHRLDEALRLADRIVVLRDGRKVIDAPRAEMDHEGLVAAIAGTAELQADGAKSEPTGTVPMLEVTGLEGAIVRDLDLHVLPGEVVGIAGALGSGREEVCTLLFGAAPGTATEVRVDGRAVGLTTPAASIAAGMGFVPGERKTMGAVLDFSGRENLTLPRLRPLRRLFGGLDVARERQEAAEMVRTFDVRPADTDRPLATLSGGNQQKVVLTKWLRLRPKVLLLEEPTQGVDVSTKAAIYNTVLAAAARAAVLVCSSDARELARLCNRVYVLDRGRITTELTGAEVTESNIIRASYGSPVAAGAGSR